MLRQSFDLTLLFFCFELGIGTVLVVLPPKLVDFFAFLLRCGRHELEVLLSLLQSPFFLLELVHFFFLQAFNLLGLSLLHGFDLPLLSAYLPQQVVILRFLLGKHIVVLVVALNCLLELILLLPKQGFYLTVDVGLALVVFLMATIAVNHFLALFCVVVVIHLLLLVEHLLHEVRT